VNAAAWRRGGGNELTVVRGQGFIVSAKGHGVELAELKQAVGAMDLGKLEAMKDVGFQKWRGVPPRSTLSERRPS